MSNWKVEFNSKYAKFFVALAGGLTVFAAAMSDNEVSTDEFFTIAAAILTPLGVLRVPNASPDEPTAEPETTDSTLL